MIQYDWGIRMTIELKSNENDKAVFTVEIQGEEIGRAHV